MVASPHTSVCASSPKFFAGALILTLGMDRHVVWANIQASQSFSWEVGSNLTPMMALLSTSLHALVTVMWPRQWCSSMTDTGSTALAVSSACTTLYRQPWVQAIQPILSPWGDTSLRWPPLIWA